MKKIIKAIELEKFSIETGSIVTEMYDSSKDMSKINEALGRDATKEYKDGRKVLKEKIIKALNECDDFEIDFSSDSYWGDECELITYKIEIESDKDLNARKRKAKRASVKAAKKRKELKELKDKEDYERLKKKFTETN